MGFNNGDIPSTGYANNFMIKGSGICFESDTLYVGDFYMDKDQYPDNQYDNDINFYNAWSISKDKAKH